MINLVLDAADEALQAPPRLPFLEVREPEPVSRLGALAQGIAERLNLNVEFMTAAPPAQGWYAEVLVGPVALHLKLSAVSFEALNRLAGIGEDYPSNDALFPLAVEGALETLFDEMERIINAPVRLKTIREFSNDLPVTLSMPRTAPTACFHVTEGNGRFPVWLWMDTSEIDLLPVPSTRFALAGRIGLPFRVTVFHRTLPKDVLKTLDVGDVIVADVAYPSEETPLGLEIPITSELALAGTLKDKDKFVVEKKARRSGPAGKRPLPRSGRRPNVLTENQDALGENQEGLGEEGALEENSDAEQVAASEPNEDTDAPKPAAPKGDRLLSPRDIDQAAVTMTIDVGSIDLSVKALRELTPGQVLSFSRPTQGPATLVVNGYEIGTADLVNVNGQLGARIRSLS